MKKIRTIYALTTVADDYRPRYIGTTIGRPNFRLYLHERAAMRNSRFSVHCWIRNRISSGYEIIIQKIEELQDDISVEIFWIKFYRNKYNNMLNVMDGGEGTLAGSRHSEEHKLNISKGLLASGRDYTEQSKKTAEKLKGKKLSEAHILALKNAKRPKWTEERRAKVAKTNSDPQVKKRRSESAKLRSNRVEEKERLSLIGSVGASKRWNKNLI